MAAIGINRYHSGTWRTLQNAVSDARGAAHAFRELGFEPKMTLSDETATRSAFLRLTDDLKTLSPHDSLVIFFAGHGYTEQRAFSDGMSARIGYLVPTDADGMQLSSFVRLDAWLCELAQLPARHVLVILDCCGSGIALAPRYRMGGESVMGARWRGLESARAMAPLRSLQSRRVITSALDAQLALDEGPIAGHSLFTGCLISALSGDLFAKLGRSEAASSELFTYIREQVWNRSQSQQTPDFGALDRDERGELVLEQPPAPTNHAVHAPAMTLAPGAIGTVRRKLSLADFRTPMTRIPVLEPWTEATLLGDAEQELAPVRLGESADRRRPDEHVSMGINHAPRRTGASPLRNAEAVAINDTSRTSNGAAEPAAAQADQRPNPGLSIGPGTARCTPPSATPLVPTSPRSVASHRAASPRGGVDPAFVAMLDRHEAERGRGRPVVSILAADALAATTSWGSWSARHGKLTLTTSATSVDGATTELLSVMPWLRLLRVARSRIATAAGLDLDGLDAALSDDALDDCSAWLEDIAGDAPATRVAAWLLSWIVAPWGTFLDPATAPVQGAALLSAACELAAPVAVLFHHPAPDAIWLGRTLRAARDLASYTPSHPIAVTAPEDLVRRVLNDSAAGDMKLRRGVVPLARAPRLTKTSGTQLAQLASELLARDASTSRLFESGVRVPVHDRDHAISVDLFSREALLAIEIDDWYRSGDPQHHRDARSSDAQLQHAGFYVLRFTADDIEHRPDAFLDEVALALAIRRTSGSFLENAHVPDTHTR